MGRADTAPLTNEPEATRPDPARRLTHWSRLFTIVYMAVVKSVVLAARVSATVRDELQRLADEREMSLSGLATKILTTFTKVAPAVIDAPPGYADSERVRMSRVAIDALHSVEVLARLVEPRGEQRTEKEREMTAEQVTREAKEILKVAVAPGSDGTIMLNRTMGGTAIQTGDKANVIPTGADDRTVAFWIGGLEDLLRDGHIRETGTECFKVTREGYIFAEELR